MGRVDMSCVALLVGATYETIYLPLFVGTARAMGRVDMTCVALLVESTYETIYLLLFAGTARAMGRVDISCVALLYSWSYKYMTLSYHYLLEQLELWVGWTFVAFLVESTYETI